jgi:hypothetical protein
MWRLRSMLIVLSNARAIVYKITQYTRRKIHQQLYGRNGIFYLKKDLQKISLTLKHPTCLSWVKHLLNLL